MGMARIARAIMRRHDEPPPAIIPTRRLPNGRTVKEQQEWLRSQVSATRARSCPAYLSLDTTPSTGYFALSARAPAMPESWQFQDR